MSARVIVSGAFVRAPQAKTSSKGNAYLIATIREAKGDDARFWSIFVFSESAIAAINQLEVGEPVAVAGEFAVELYKPEGKEPRISYRITVDAVLNARRPKRDAPATERRHPAPNQSNRKREFDDNVPF